MEKTLLSPNAALFAHLEYFLKVQLESSTAKITTCHSLSNPTLTEQFPRDKLVLQTLFDSVDLIGGNVEEDICKRGFQSDGVFISIGKFQPKSQGRVHKVLLCDVAIGRAFVIDKNGIDQSIPPEYDSFYIQDDIQNNDDKEYKHEYYIKNMSQLLPRYLIQYEFDPVLEKESRKKRVCDDCEQKEAVVYCDADKAYLCHSCDVQLHQSKITRGHVRTQMGQGTDVFGDCPTHKKQIQYFCSQCHEPICIDCTIIGSHSSTKHTLVPMQEYFSSVMKESKLVNPQLQDRKMMIHDQIGNIQSRADAVVQMGTTITNKIDEICSKAKQQCKELIEQKLTVLVGDEQELKRQLGEMNRLEEFLKYIQEGDSMQCVYTWHIHQSLVEQLADFKFFRSEIDVELDAKVEGTLSVVVDEQRKVMQGPVTPKRPQLPQRVVSPPNIPYPSSPSSPVYHSPPQKTVFGMSPLFSSPPKPSVYGVINSSPKSVYGGMTRVPPNPKKERKVERRTSDFFHEALSMAHEDSNDDFDSFSQYSRG